MSVHRVTRGLLASLLLTIPAVATAQTPAKPAVIGMAAGGATPVAPIKAALERRGYVADRDFVFKPLSAEGKVDRLAGMIDELAAAHVRAIITFGYPAAKLAKDRAPEIPVVTTMAGDPLATGLIATLARPGGHVTGVADFSRDLAAKRLQMLKEAVPTIRTVAVLWNSDDRGMTLRYEQAQTWLPSSASRWCRSACGNPTISAPPLRA